MTAFHMRSPFPSCPECGLPVQGFTHAAGYSAHVPYQGTYVIEGGDPWPPDAHGYGVEVTPMPSVDWWTVEPCGHRFRKLELKLNEDGLPVSLSLP